MSLSFLALRIRHSFLRGCEKVFAGDLFSIFDNFSPLRAKKTTIASKHEDPDYGDLLMNQSCGAKIPFMGAKIPFLGAKSLFTGAKSPFMGAKIPFTGTKIPFTGAKIPFMGAKIPFTGAIIPFTGAKISFMEVNKLCIECKKCQPRNGAMNDLPRETYPINLNKNESDMTKYFCKQRKSMDLRSSFSAFVKAVPGSDFHNLTTICNASVKRVSAYDKVFIYT